MDVGGWKVALAAKKGEAERHATFLLVLEQKKDNLS
jgi:hypothetical protein